MKYFLLPDKDKDPTNDFKIVKVQEQDLDSFLIRHGQDVIYEGNSVTEILIQFGENAELDKQF